MTKNFKIDATGKKIGRLASEIASILLGKTSPDFQKNKVAGVKVEIVNASKLDINDKKSKTKVYTHYTGYSGGLRKTNLEDLVIKKGYAEVLQKAVSGMIHNTKLKALALKNLIIND